MSTPIVRRLAMSFAGLLGFALAFSHVHADTQTGDYQVQEFEGEATTDQLIQALDPGDIKTRGLRPRDEPLKPKAVALRIPFEFDSYKLTPKAERMLDNVGAALQSDRLREHAFIIEGHTDSIGSESYNQNLSELRASEVRRYLTQAYQIDPSRLHTVGKGERDLLDQADPTSARNRRVQIVLQNP